MKFICFYCGAALGIQYSSQYEGSAVKKFTCFYYDITAVGIQSSSFVKGTVINKYITTQVNTAVLIYKL